MVSCALTILLFSRVQSLRLSGVAWNFGSAPLHVRLDTGPESVHLLSWKTPDSFPAGIGSDDRQRVVGLWFDEGIYRTIREIPNDARVRVIHRGVEFRRLRWALGGTVIESEGRTYVCDRSPACFFWYLSLISAAPLCLWLIVAIPAAILRQSRKMAAPS
jgi:hypothetical protein